MTKEEAIEAAYDRLPLPSETQKDRSAIAAMNWERNSLRFYRFLTFKKQRVNDIVIGWELETID